MVQLPNDSPGGLRTIPSAWQCVGGLIIVLVGVLAARSRLDAQTEMPPTSLSPALRGQSPPALGQPNVGAAGGSLLAPGLTGRQARGAAAAKPAARRRITIREAILWALEHNPDILVRRRDLGIARAQVVIAETYPFNPVFETTLQGADNFGLRQHIRQSYTLLQEVEIAGQGQQRRAEAGAARERTGWEIRQQELLLAVQVARAFQALLYRQRKYELARSTVKLNTELARQVRELFEANPEQVTRADLILAQAEAADARRAEGVARVGLRTAQVDFRTALGIVEDVEFVPEGELSGTLAELQSSRVIQQALATRPDIRARQAALREADAALRLACASQTPNVTLGPAFEIDESKTFFGGATVSIPLAVWNRKEGEILQARAQRLKALTDLTQTRVRVRLEVLAALDAYRNAQDIARTFQGDVIPQLERGVGEAEKLFPLGLMDFLRLVEIRRRLISARDQLLDALNELNLGQLQVTSAAGRPLFPTTTTAPPTNP